MFHYKLKHSNGWTSDESSIITHEKQFSEKEFIGIVAQILYDHRDEDVLCIDEVCKYLVEEYDFKYLLEDVSEIDVSPILPFAGNS